LIKIFQNILRKYTLKIDKTEFNDKQHQKIFMYYSRYFENIPFVHIDFPLELYILPHPNGTRIMNEY